MSRNFYQSRKILQLGNEGDEVYKLQNDLITLEFLRGTPNGIFGVNTRRAVELFQQTFGIPVTGIADNDTLYEIEKALTSPFPSTRPTLRLGDQNTSVKSLEQRLIILGYLDEAADGLFDINLQNAVMSFQSGRGLEIDGVVGPRTWRELDQSFAAVGINMPTIKPTIQEQDQNEYVKLAQEMLTSFGYFAGNSDGIFGRNTTNAVKELQRTYGLEPTGIIDYFTWEVLDSLISPTFIHIPILKEGSTAPEVRILQDKLKVAGFFPGTVTGSFGPETTSALKDFQIANGIPATGVTDRETWERLFAVTAIIFEGTIPHVNVMNRPTLKYGDQGEFVKELQRDLKQVLFYDGAISGNFDQLTLNAVKAFQTNNKLTADGIVGRNTWSALIYLYSPLAICGDETPPPTPPTTPPSTFKGIVIDAGHGGSDSGAVSSAITEKEYTLRISQYMANRFRELNVPFSMTRNSDETLTRDERIRRMTQPFGDVSNVIVISNHLNAGGGEGAEVIYALRNTSDLARGILTEIGNAGQKTRRYYQRALADDPSKDYYYIMRETKNLQPVIVEYGFLDNANDIPRIQKYWDKYAEAAIKATMDYMGLPYTPPGVGKATYVVQPGDSLWSIAQRFNTTVEEIKSLNNLTSNNLNIGQQLFIPGSGLEIPPPSGNIVYVVKPGDSLWSIAQSFDTTVEAIKSLNNLTSNLLSIGQQLFIPGVSVETPETSPIVHTVQPGETLYSIANLYGTTVALIRDANNLTSDILRIGQRLIIPGTSSVETIIYSVMPGDSLWSIAQKFGTTVEEIKALNNLTSNLLSIGQQLKIPVVPSKQETFIYIVQAGDTLWNIGQRFNTTIETIRELNGIVNNTLSIGQELRIPR